MPRLPRLLPSRARLTIAFAASLAIALPGSGQSVPPMAPPTPGPNQDIARQHLTAARNALNDMTQLPAAGQLGGNPRRLVQQLITDFNGLLTTNVEWRASYDKIDSTLDALLQPPVLEPPSGTAGTVGTSGAVVAANAIDPAIRAKLVEFRAHLDQFEDVASGRAAPIAPALAPPPPPALDPPAAASPVAPATIDDRPDSPPAAVPDAPEAQAVSPGTQGVARDVLLHVEAVEVILGAQAAAQKAAIAAAGGAVVAKETASGSTKTTIREPNVTLNAEQLDQITTHLKDIRRLLERK